MPLLYILLIAFVVVPIAEIALLIQVGSAIGALPTIALVVLTAVLGATLIRAQGLATVVRMRESMDRGELPAVELLEAACLLVAGALLLTPGFVTDAVGFVLLVPALRRALVLAALERGVLRSSRGRQAPGGRTAGGPNGGRVIEGEFRREDR